MTQSHRQSLEQKRSASAWKHTNAVPEKDRAVYKSRALSLPSMIQMNGLGSTLAFLCSKPNKEAYRLAYQHVSEWVTGQIYDQPEHDLLELVRTENVDIYRQAAAEAIQYGIWLKRYVEAWKIEAKDE